MARKKKKNSNSKPITSYSKATLVFLTVVSIAAGLFALIASIAAIIFLPVAILLFWYAYVCIKEQKRRKVAQAEKEAREAERQREKTQQKAAETTEKVKSEPIEVKPVQKVEVSAEEFERLRAMCIDIHNEYNNLLKGYSGQSERGKVHTLKECWRKLEVIETTANKYGCYDEINMYEEYEKIEKKARSFINAYIRNEREDGKENYDIDIMQFTDDLDFISDFIYEKDEKLNKELYN